MQSYLEGSLLYRMLLYLSDLYKSSFLKIVVATISKWAADSLVRKIILNYLETKSKAEYTVTYRILSAFGRKADNAVGKIRHLFSTHYKTSRIFSIVGEFEAACSKGMNLLVLTAIVTFILGYGLAVTVRGIWSAGALLNVALLAVVGAVVVTTVDRWQLWMKNSVLYKLCQYIWE
jgi:hypothetical protein